MTGRPTVSQQEILRRRARLWTAVFIAGLVLSGATAIPLEWELQFLAHRIGPAPSTPGSLADWIILVRSGIHLVCARYPFMVYGTDWLAFGHFVIAFAFIGLLRDPVRNEWLLTFGLIACALVIPYALVLGAVRGIPIWWRIVDCSFGVGGLVPLLLCRRCVTTLAQLAPEETRLKADP